MKCKDRKMFRGFQQIKMPTFMIWDLKLDWYLFSVIKHCSPLRQDVLESGAWCLGGAYLPFFGLKLAAHPLLQSFRAQKKREPKRQYFTYNLYPDTSSSPGSSLVRKSQKWCFPFAFSQASSLFCPNIILQLLPHQDARYSQNPQTEEACLICHRSRLRQ